MSLILSFNYLLIIFYVMNVVLDCNTIYILLIIGNITGMSHVNKKRQILVSGCRGSSVDMVTVLRAGQSGVRFSAEARYLSNVQNVQTRFRTHSDSYSLDTKGCFPGGKEAGARI
jgi:hypothetical protein